MARDGLRDLITDADPEDLLLLDDLLGITDPDVELPKIDPNARRRRLTALLNAASLARESPVVYVVEDAHWIDEVSESMLADFLSVIPQTRIWHPAVIGGPYTTPKILVEWTYSERALFGGFEAAFYGAIGCAF